MVILFLLMIVLIELRVEDVVDGTDIVCTVINGGELGSKKGVNVPNVSIKLTNYYR